ncbi:hypothetical protein [Microcoleus vaginatus]|uniref:hypothetical protein n=1 Tax=Microcoleus vaginatus TaxID=119532 RepID=UPI001F6260C4
MSFANIESNLAALMAVDVSDRATEYGRLLNEALEIGMSAGEFLVCSKSSN